MKLGPANKSSIRLWGIVSLALAVTIVVCVLCRSLFEQTEFVVDCLAPQGDMTITAGVVYYKSKSDPQFSERQKCKQGIGTEFLRENQNHVLVLVPGDATECRLDLWFDRPVPTAMPIEFYTREGVKPYETRISPWNKRVLTVMLAADDFQRSQFYGLRFFSFATIVFICAFAVGSLWQTFHGVNWIVVSAFLLLILAPNKEITKEEASANENRNLAKFPDMEQFGFLDVSAYCKPFSEAYEDRFYGRADLMSLHSSILKEFDDRGNASAFIGLDNWLFYMPTLEDFSNKAPPLDDKTFDALYRKLTLFSEWAHKKGKVFVLFVAPDKCRVYPEYVRGYKKKRSDDESRTEQLISRLRERCDFPIVYPRKRMLELKRKMPYPLYFKNDTHWTSEGAYYAGYQEIMAAIKNDRFYKDNTKTLKIGKWRMQKLDNGDLNRMLNRKLTDESQEYRFPVLNDRDVTLKCKAIKLPVPFSIVSSANAKGRGSLFCFGDSFSSLLLPFFEHSCKAFCRAPISTNLSAEDLLALNKSEVVILEIVERHFVSLIFADINLQNL